MLVKVADVIIKGPYDKSNIVIDALKREGFCLIFSHKSDDGIYYSVSVETPDEFFERILHRPLEDKIIGG